MSIESEGKLNKNERRKKLTGLKKSKKIMKQKNLE